MQVNENLSGSVLAYGKDGAAHFLTAGDEVPAGVQVDSSLLADTKKPAPRKKRKSTTDGGNETQ